MDQGAFRGADRGMDQERVKYERMHAVPGYSPGPGLGHVHKLIARLKEGDSIIDFGCGTGDAAMKMHELGFQVYLVDIAHNAIRQGVKEALRDRIFITALHALPAALPRCTWGFCTDVMEHLPEAWVQLSLKAMREKVDNVFFTISGTPDGWGKKIGEVLHLTVKSREWWMEEIKKHFKTVESINDASWTFEIVGRG